MGIVERLSTLVVVGTITMSSVLLLMPPAVAGWIATRPRVVAGERRTATPAVAISGGALTGLVDGLFVAAAVALVNLIGVPTVRQVFIEVSPALMQIMRFHHGPVLGTILLVVGSAVAGAAGGGVRVTPDRYRRPAISGISAVIFVSLLDVAIAPAFLQVHLNPNLLYSAITLGLTWVGSRGGVRSGSCRRHAAAGDAPAGDPAPRP